MSAQSRPPFRPPEEPEQPEPPAAAAPPPPPACSLAGQSPRARAQRAMSSSAGSGHQPSQSRAIPTRTVSINDAAQLPHDYCTTPGGTLFSTTPGGERPPRAGHRAALIPGACSLPPPCSPSLPSRSFNSGRVHARPLRLAT